MDTEQGQMDDGKFLLANGVWQMGTDKSTRENRLGETTCGKWENVTDSEWAFGR